MKAYRCHGNLIIVFQITKWQLDNSNISNYCDQYYDSSQGNHQKCIQVTCSFFRHILLLK